MQYTLIALELKKKQKYYKKKKQKGIYRTQACDSIMWGYSCNKFIDFTLNNRKLVGFSSILSKKN